MQSRRDIDPRHYQTPLRAASNRYPVELDAGQGRKKARPAAAASLFDSRGRKWLGGSTFLQYLPQHHVQDASVAVILEFDGGVDPGERLELNNRAITARGPHLDRAAGLLDGEGASLVLSDFETFAALRKDRPSLCGIVLADRAGSEQAIEWMMHGALDYVLKPLNHDGLVRAIRDALRVSRDVEVPTYDQADERAPTEQMVGQSPAMQEVYKLIGLLAPREVNVLITGESGTGKDLVARALYQHSARKDRPFLAVNCAAIPETLLESELFGHEKGAFTGADRRRIGKRLHHGQVRPSFSDASSG